jgi:hypothetical protein
MLLHVQKAIDFIGMCSRFIILLIKFSEVFTAQLVSSSLCIIQTISHQIPIGGSIYFSYTTVINIQEVSLGVIIVIGLGKTSKII